MDHPARVEPQEDADTFASITAAATCVPADVISLRDERQRRKKPTSGSEKRQRSKAIRVRVSPSDLERLKTEAAAAGMSVAGYLASGRLAAETATRPRMTRRRSSVAVAALTDALVAFNRVGNNQNQIARALNELLLACDERSYGRLASEVQDLAHEIRRLPTSFAEPLAAIMAALHGKAGLHSKDQDA